MFHFGFLRGRCDCCHQITPEPPTPRVCMGSEWEEEEGGGSSPLCILFHFLGYHHPRLTAGETEAQLVQPG